MARPALTVANLLGRGFVEASAWVIKDTKLRRVGDLPDAAGVYAFAIHDTAMYVGVASRSLVRRIGFYQTPGPTQSTNIRLNTLILDALRDTPVRILYACPEFSEWNGLPVDRAMGLEAGLIASFDLPWNRKGTLLPANVKMDIVGDASVASPVSLHERVMQEIARRPRQTEAEIARSVFGLAAVQQQVNPTCRALVQQGRVRRLGSGGVRDPYVYVVVT